MLGSWHGLLDLYVCGLLHAYTHGTSVCSLIQRSFVESAQNLTLEKSQGVHIMVTHPLDDHTQSCLTLAFRSEYSRLSCTTNLSISIHSFPQPSGCGTGFPYRHSLDWHSHSIAYQSTWTVYWYKIQFFHYFRRIWPYWKMGTGKHNFHEMLLF